MHPLEEHHGVIWTRFYIVSLQKTKRPMKDKSNIIIRAQVNLKITVTSAKELQISGDNVVQQCTEAQEWTNMGNEVSLCPIGTRGHLRSKPKCISTFPGRSELNKNLRTDNTFIIEHVIGITWTEIEPSIAISINYANPVPNSMLALARKFLQRIQQKSSYQAASERCIVLCLKTPCRPPRKP